MRLGGGYGAILFDAALWCMVVGKKSTISHKMVKVDAARSMKQLFGRHENRLDGKGRVSVPAAFRNAWKNEPEKGEAGMTLILRPSLIAGCIEGWPLPNYAKYEEELAAMAETDPDRQGFATKIYSDAVELELDGQGRIMLPDHLIEEAQLGETACFLGRGTHFHIWEPEAAKAFLAATRALAPRLTFGAPAPAQTPKESP